MEFGGDGEDKYVFLDVRYISVHVAMQWIRYYRAILGGVFVDALDSIVFSYIFMGQ